MGLVPGRTQSNLSEARPAHVPAQAPQRAGSRGANLDKSAPQCQIVYDKFHVIQHANEAVDEVRRAEFFRKGTKMRGLVKGKKWLLPSRWKNLTTKQRGDMNRLFQLNRRLFKAYLLKESLERLWDYHYEGAMLN